MAGSARQFLLGAICSAFALAAQAAVVTVDVAGTFGRSITPTFPFPDLIGGSFSGSFTYDDAALPVLVSANTNEYAILANNVALRSPTNDLEYVITATDTAELRVITTGMTRQLIIFLGSSVTPLPDDLRLAFDVAGLGLVADATPLTAAELAAAVTSGTFLPGPDSILDVEGVPADFTISVASATVTVPVPGPAPLALLALGAGGMLLAGRRRGAAAG